MYFGCPLLRALNNTRKTSFFPGKVAVGQIVCSSMYWVLSRLLVVDCGFVSLTVCLLPVRGQSLLSYILVWLLVPTTCYQGPAGSVNLWKCGLRHCSPRKIRQHYIRDGHRSKQASLPRSHRNPAGWDLSCTPLSLGRNKGPVQIFVHV